uniref:Platelet-derived growth factor (PDGF) family profile domain-containing protein n=1 Tax=Anopheles christyi TaxID=43041 RepID=A0A182K116_9DIPT
MERMIKDGICKVPKPKIVPASTDRTKIFTPQCTILHRCEEDTGCCGPTQTCAPKFTNDVQLYFYVSSDSYVQNVGQRQQSTIALTFTNHTECHCVERSGSSSRAQNQNSLEHSAEGSGGSSGSGTGGSSSCTCPRHFKSVIDSESQCYCDCLSNDRDCIRFKEGFESFSMETRKCIRSKKCNVPRCEYGLYNRHEGRCPKKSDRFNEQFPQFR